MGQCTPNQYAKRHQSGSTISKDSRNSLNSFSKMNSGKSILRNGMGARNSTKSLNEMRKSVIVDSQNKLKIKVPLNKNQTQFKWVDADVLIYPSTIGELAPEVIKQATFQEKLSWFRAKIKELKKSHIHGFELVQINRQRIIESSLNALQGVNLLKELKVQFTGDKAEDAGGGLTREWLHLAIKQIISSQVGIFKLANTDETAYQLIWDSTASDESTFQVLNLLGLLMSKAIIQNIPIDCHLDYSILRQLCSQPVQLSDVYSYDKSLYESWVNILEMPNAQQLCLDGTLTYRVDGDKTEQIEVISNGKNTLIDDSNKQEYISELVKFYCSRSVESYLEQLFQAFTKFIPRELFEIFEPYQLEMLMSGPFLIDIQDWKNNSKYEGYDPDDQIIQWFWEIVEKSGQEGYRNLLHYCTGSTRVPIQGFAKLESNSGHVKKFCIRKIENSNENKYPKSYTCFNRLELPAYESKEELEESLEFILKDEFNEFGLS